MNACPHCKARLEPASYMHDASSTTWFDAICGSCGYHTEASPTREARAAVAELIDCVGDARSLLAEIDAGVREEHAKNGHPKSKSVVGIINDRLTAALARVGGAK